MREIKGRIGKRAGSKHKGSNSEEIKSVRRAAEPDEYHMVPSVWRFRRRSTPHGRSSINWAVVTFFARDELFPNTYVRPCWPPLVPSLVDPRLIHERLLFFTWPAASCFLSRLNRCIEPRVIEEHGSSNHHRLLVFSHSFFPPLEYQCTGSSLSECNCSVVLSCSLQSVLLVVCT